MDLTVIDLTVIILSWNTRKLLEECLTALRDSPPAIACEIIVVDNASSDDSRQMVKSLFPEVKLLVSPMNVGFGAGNNLALPEARGRYLLFLNSDTIVCPDALDRLVQYADSRPEVGIVGPKLLNGDGTLQFSCRRYPNLGTGFFRNTPLGRLFPGNKHTTDYLMQDWDHNSVRDVDWVSGAALMIRRTLVEQIGSFDDEYYMFCEDVDLCWRANHANIPQAAAPEDRWKVAYVPEAVVYHLIGKSTDKAPTRMTYEFHRSQYLFYKKHYRATTSVFLRPIIPVGIALRAVGQMTRFRVRYWQRKLLKKSKRRPLSR